MPITVKLTDRLTSAYQYHSTLEPLPPKILQGMTMRPERWLWQAINRRVQKLSLVGLKVCPTSRSLST